MNKWPFLVATILLCGCMSRSAIMTQTSFNSIETGQDIGKITEQMGEPYAIHKGSGGTEEYEYIERVNSGNRLIYENHYILIVKNGVIVGKKTSREENPPFDLIYQDDPNHHQYP